MIYRAKKEKGTFTQIHKDLIYDNQLSPEEKGLMVYLLSQSDEWQFYETEIAKHYNCGVKIISKIIKKLIDKGYIEREETRDTKGHYVYLYYIYETLKTKEEMAQKE